MKDMDTDSEFSLLYPIGSERPSDVDRWGENTVEDLGIDQLAWALSIDNKYHDGIKSLLLELCGDSQIIEYRQKILDDLLNNAEMTAGFEELLPLLEKLHDYALAHSQGSPLHQTLGRMTELNTYVICVKKLQSLFDKAEPVLHSPGLAALRKKLKQIESDEIFQSLAKSLPELLSKLNDIPSITIGLNLDSELRPIQATLISINDKPFKGGTLMDRLMGRKSGRKPNMGIGPLHSVPQQQLMAGGRIINLPTRMEPTMVPLFNDLHELLKLVILPIAGALQQYAQVNARSLIALEGELAFYLGAIRVIQQMRARGLAVCRPKILNMEERSCHMKCVYNLLLALRKAEDDLDTNLSKVVVPNNVEFGLKGRIFILTGPNQGGKTVYTQALGVAQVLFQAGLYVPAEAARMSPVDGVYTHFATLEKTNSGMGRLGEEAKRLNEIFHSVTDKSLVLLNESLSSTSPGESLYLAQDIVRALRLFGVRAIFATHLHELAEGVDLINAEVAGDSQVVSLVAGVALTGNKVDVIDNVVPRTYKIKPGPPRGLSYAKGIASQHGISFEQLTDRWRKQQEQGSGK